MTPFVRVGAFCLFSDHRYTFIPRYDDVGILLGACLFNEHTCPLRHKQHTTMKKSKKLGSKKNGKKKRIPAHVRAGIEEELVRLRKLVELEAIRQDVETEIIRLQGFC